MVVVHGLPVDPMRDLALSDADSVSQPLLTSCDLDGSFNSAHGAYISNAYVESQQQHCLLSVPRGISVPNMAKGKGDKGSRRPPLTAHEREVARQLKARWRAMPDAERPTQEKMGELWGEGGSQSVISQYLNGVIPLNVTAAIRFADIFQCKPHEILDVPELHGRPTPTISNVVQFQKDWPFLPVTRKQYDDLSDAAKQQIIGFIQAKLGEFEVKANAGKKK
jgi:hypothetical protein